jgi:hypothetical protein
MFYKLQIISCIWRDFSPSPAALAMTTEKGKEMKNKRNKKTSHTTFFIFSFSSLCLSFTAVILWGEKL